MSCSKQAVPAAFCDFIEVSTGERITQNEWHQIKKLAKEEGFPVSKTRLSPHIAYGKLSDLKSAIVLNGDSQLVTSVNKWNDMAKKWDDSLESARTLLANPNPPSFTEGTDSVITFLTKYGVKDTLNKIRKPSVDGGTGSPSRVTHALATPTAGADYHDYGIGTAYETRTMRPLPDGNYETTSTAYYVEGYDNGSSPTAPYQIVECVNVIVHPDPDDAGRSQISADSHEYIFMDEGLLYDRLEDAESVAEHYAKNLEK